MGLQVAPPLSGSYSCSAPVHGRFLSRTSTHTHTAVQREKRKKMERAREQETRQESRQSCMQEGNTLVLKSSRVNGPKSPNRYNPPNIKITSKKNPTSQDRQTDTQTDLYHVEHIICYSLSSRVRRCRQRTIMSVLSLAREGSQKRHKRKSAMKAELGFRSS